MSDENGPKKAPRDLRERVAQTLARRDDRNPPGLIWDEIDPGDQDEYRLDADAVLAVVFSEEGR